MFWSRQDKKVQRPERKPANGLRLSSAIDRQLPETPSLDGYRVEFLTPEQSRLVLEALIRLRRR